VAVEGGMKLLNNEFSPFLFSCEFLAFPPLFMLYSCVQFLVDS